VEELRKPLREGKIYRPERIEQALTNLFRKGNPSTLHELALRAIADKSARRPQVIADAKSWIQR